MVTYEATYKLEYKSQVKSNLMEQRNLFDYLNMSVAKNFTFLKGNFMDSSFDHIPY